MVNDIHLIDDDDDDEVEIQQDQHRNKQQQKQILLTEDYVKSKLKQIYNIPSMKKELFDLVERGFRRQIKDGSQFEFKFNTGVYFGTSTSGRITNDDINSDENNEDKALKVKQETFALNNTDTNKAGNRGAPTHHPHHRNHVQLSLYNNVSDERQLFEDKIDALYANSNGNSIVDKKKDVSETKPIFGMISSSSNTQNNIHHRPIWHYVEVDFTFDQNANTAWRLLPETDPIADPKTQHEQTTFRAAVNKLLTEPAKIVPLLKYAYSLFFWRSFEKLSFCQINFKPSSTCHRLSYSSLGFTQINQLIHLTGTVVRISTSVSVCTQMTYACNNCGQTQVLPAHNGILNFPGSCVTRGCNSTRFSPKVTGRNINDTARTLCDGVQYAKLQEDSSSSSSGGNKSGNQGHFQFFPDEGDGDDHPNNANNTQMKKGKRNNNNNANVDANANAAAEDDALMMMMNGMNDAATGADGFMMYGGNNNNHNNGNNNSPSSSGRNQQSGGGGGGGGRSLIEISLKGRFRNQVSPGDNISVIGILTSRKLEAGGRGTKAAQLLSCEVTGLEVIKASSAGMSLSSKLQEKNNNNKTNSNSKDPDDANSNTHSTTSSIQRNRMSSSTSTMAAAAETLHNNTNITTSHSNNSLINTNKILNGLDLLPLLIKKFCPQIYGHVKTKAALLLSLVGGTAKVSPDAPRSQLHVLMLGDAGIGKSQLLRASWQASRRGVFVTANSTSSCGLTITISRTSTPGGGDNTSCEAGAVLYGDGGVTCIDEIDKGHASEQKALLEVMEQQTVSIAKAGIVFSMPIRTSVVAAGNPRAGRFDNGKSYAENVGLSPALVSRFDFVMLLQDHDGSVNFNHDDDDGNENNNNNNNDDDSQQDDSHGKKNNKNRNNNSDSNNGGIQKTFPRLVELIGPLSSLYPEYQNIIEPLKEKIEELIEEERRKIEEARSQNNNGRHNANNIINNNKFDPERMLPDEETSLINQVIKEFREKKQQQQQQEGESNTNNNDMMMMNNNNFDSQQMSSSENSSFDTIAHYNNTQNNNATAYRRKKEERVRKQQSNQQFAGASSISHHVLRTHQAAKGALTNNSNSNNDNNGSSSTLLDDNNGFNNHGKNANNKKKNTSASTAIGININALLPGIDVREIIEHCQTEFHPYLNSDAQLVLFHAYLDARKRYFECGTVDAAEITPRFLQSLIRATEARAKLAQSSVATKEHALFAVQLLEACRSLSAAANGGIALSDDQARARFQATLNASGASRQKVSQNDLVKQALKSNAEVEDVPDAAPNKPNKKYMISKKKAEEVIEQFMKGKQTAASYLERLYGGGELLDQGNRYQLHNDLVK